MNLCTSGLSAASSVHRLATSSLARLVFYGLLIFVVSASIVAWNAPAGPLDAVQAQQSWQQPGMVQSHAAILDDQTQQLTIIEPGHHVMAVYHVDRQSGEISLKSVRNFHWDLQMDEFNSANPRPREVRVAVERP